MSERITKQRLYAVEESVNVLLAQTNADMRIEAQATNGYYVINPMKKHDVTGMFTRQAGWPLHGGSIKECYLFLLGMQSALSMAQHKQQESEDTTSRLLPNHGLTAQQNDKTTQAIIDSAE